MNMNNISQSDRKGFGLNGTCICPECGYKTNHERNTPCMDKTCPKCGAKMNRLDNRLYNEYLKIGYTEDTAWNLMDDLSRDEYFKIFNERYPDVPANMFAFPEGIGLPKEYERKYPIDDKHIKPAIGYFNMPKNRTSALKIITEQQWAAGGKRIASAATKYYKVDYIYDEKTKKVIKK